MANYEKMCDLFDLAMSMQESSEGVSLEDIRQKYAVRKWKKLKPANVSNVGVLRSEA